jgi:signal transduction histidine kinase/FixJ family two-component response regulator
MAEDILLVDDEPDIREILGLYLAEMGYRVTTAENGAQALELFRQTKPPIVLTDIKMPVMDGIELLQKIKHEVPDTEVIMITGHGDMELAIKSLKLEATDFITKPINDDMIEIALKRAAEKITMRQQLRSYTESLEAMVEEKSAQLVEAERLVALGQAVEGLTSARQDIAEDLERGIRYFYEMPCFVSIHNPKLEVVAANQLYQKRLDAHIGNPSWQIYKGYEQHPQTCPAGKTFTKGEGLQLKEVLKYKDGQHLPVMVHTAPIRSSSGTVELVLEISADISEVNRLRKQLQTSQQNYQQLFDEVPCYISVQDRNFNIIATNRRFKEDFGEQIHSTCFQLYKHRQVPCPNCPVAKTFADGQSHQTETIVTALSGDQVNVLIWTAPLQNESGNITHVMEMATNITQLRHMQERLSSLGLLISSISHGIKGVLTGLDAGLYMLESGIAKTNQDKQQEGLEVVKLMAGRIRNMVLDILHYAKKREMQWEEVDVLSFINDVAFVIEPKAQGQHIQYTLDCAPDLGRFEIDFGALHAAMVNILDNAIEACMEDYGKTEHKIDFTASAFGDKIKMTIADNGVGMDEETRDNLFTLFFSSKGRLGTGLGLFIANNTIQQHGGTIQVQSQKGEGSQFIIELPRKVPNSIKKGEIKPSAAFAKNLTL